MKAPYLTSTSLPAGSLPRVTAKSEKLKPPMILPSVGMKTSPTSEETIFPKAAPMITPTAKSTTLPFMANSLNSAPNPTAISFLTSADGCLFVDVHWQRLPATVAPPARNHGHGTERMRHGQVMLFQFSSAYSSASLHSSAD